MKLLKTALITATATAALTGAAMAQLVGNPGTASASANATIVAPLTVTEAGGPMNFGSIAVSNPAVLATVSTDPAISPSNATNVNGTNPVGSSFDIVGDAGATVDVSVPVESCDSGAILNVTLPALDQVSVPLTGGNANVLANGFLTIAANTPGGTVIGCTYTVSALYQ